MADKEVSKIHCPACKKPLTSYKAIPKHVNGCSQWHTMGVSPGEYNLQDVTKFSEGLERTLKQGLEAGFTLILQALSQMAVWERLGQASVDACVGTYDLVLKSSRPLKVPPCPSARDPRGPLGGSGGPLKRCADTAHRRPQL